MEAIYSLAVNVVSGQGKQHGVLLVVSGVLVFVGSSIILIWAIVIGENYKSNYEATLIDLHITICTMRWLAQQSSHTANCS